jgi:hypothetical protein
MGSIELAQSSYFVAIEVVIAIDAAFYPQDLDHGVSSGEVHLVPFEIADLRGPHSMDIGHEDQGAVAMSISAHALSGFDEPHDLIMGQMFLCTEIFVCDSLGSRCR